MSQARRNRTPRAGAAVPPRAVPSASTEDYLERIGELIDRKGYARVVDIAQVLEVSQPSVTAMVQRLAEAGYLHYEKYRGLVMTQKGQAVATEIKQRHATLKRFLSLLRLDEATQENDIEGWEHCLSAATLGRLADLTDFLEGNPEVLDSFLRRRRLAAVTSSAKSRRQALQKGPARAPARC